MKALIAIPDKHHIPPSHILKLLIHKVPEADREIDRLRQVRLQLADLRDLALRLGLGEAS